MADSDENDPGSPNAASFEYQIPCGIEVSTAVNLVDTIDDVKQRGYDFVMCPLAHPRYERGCAGDGLQTAFTRSDMLLTSSQWSSYVIGRVSDWLQVDSPIPSIQVKDEQVLRQELAWAAHLGLSAVAVPLCPHSPTYVHLARSLAEVLTGLLHMHLWIQVPLTFGDAGTENFPSGRPRSDPWEWWDGVRSLCDGSAALGVCLEITADLPSDAHLARWKGEPVRAVVIPTRVFVSNSGGFPCLSPRHQRFVASVMALRVQWVVRGPALHKGGMAAYRQYLRHVAKVHPPWPPSEHGLTGYLDYLQAPLQPLQDNLESHTYETFERDAPKYQHYQLAITQALRDLGPGEGGSARVVMVVGAGRGPLVRAALGAAAEAGVGVRVYAVEKNPNALVTLRHLHRDLAWGSTVCIVHSDMREWQPPELADILVSELLGSLGDNELSPECLDGAQRLLKGSGISIPCSYTAYVAPVASQKLHSEARAWKDLKHLETPYVVKIHNASLLAPPQALWSFTHPSPLPHDNSRTATVGFRCPMADTMHGLAGYFTTQLYKDLALSTHPDTHTPDMQSWFPLYIPLQAPVYVPKGSTVEVTMWRRTGKGRVWYEWALTAPDTTPIHNLGGRSYYIGL